MKLGDQAYWLVQDDWNGGLRTSARAADVVVAAAVLGELVAIHALDVRADGVVVLDPVPPLDDLGWEVVAHVAAVPGVTARDVIDGLAPSIRGRVARRLITAGQADERRVGLWRRRVAVARAGDTRPAWVGAELTTSVQQGLPLSEQHGVLLHLVRHSSMIDNSLAGVSSRQAAHAVRRSARVIGRYDVLLQAATDAIRAAAVAR